MRKCVLPVLLGLVALMPATAQAVLQVGQAAPDFTLPDTAWVNHSFSELRGKVVAVLFWSNT